MKKFNLSRIMSKAWELFRKLGISFSECLHRAWESAKAQEVNAARIAGVNPFVIICRHILPNVRHLTIIYFTLNFGAAVMLEVLAGYLGLGGSGNIPGWGSMIAAGQERLWRGVWWELGTAGALMFILILALNLLGDSLRDALDPRCS